MFSKKVDKFLSVAPLTLMILISVSAPQLFASLSLQEARVIAVNDGDTVTLRMNGKERRTRLIGIDAPETGQEPWGQRSREHLRKILKDLHWNVFVETDIVTHDKYNRMLVYLWDDD